MEELTLVWHVRARGGVFACFGSYVYRERTPRSARSGVTAWRDIARLDSLFSPDALLIGSRIASRALREYP